MRLAAKTDANHTAVVQTLRSEGCTVVSTAAMAKGFPDLVVGIAGQTHLIEIKDGSKVPSAQSLTSDQLIFIKHWKGSPVVIIRDCEIARTWAQRIKEIYERDCTGAED